MKIGEQIKAQLKKKKWSQRQLSEATGLAESAISQIISGKREPQFSSILALLAVMPLDLKKAGING